MAKLKIVWAAVALLLNLLLIAFFYNQQRMGLATVFGIFAIGSIFRLLMAIKANKESKEGSNDATGI